MFGHLSTVHRVVALAILSMLLAACGAGSAEPSATPGPSAEAAAYLDEALDVIETHFIFIDQVDWTSLRAEAVERAADADTIEDTYAALRWVVQELRTPHTFFVPVGESPPQVQTDPMPTGQRLAGDVGMIRIPYFRPIEAAADEYATVAVEIIQEIDAQPTCGWVVDLRGNKGGNMWPMLAGVSPLLGDGEVGSFVNHTGVSQSWELRDGQSLRGGEVVSTAPDYELRQPEPPVAVLVDGFTASSGEATMIAFIGRPDTRSFGESTSGAATVPQFFEFPDGAGVVLAAAWMADRSGATWDAEVPPEELVENFGPLNSRTPLEEDEILLAALDWLGAEHGCQ